MNILQDDRIQWIRQKTVLALDITIECFNEYFIESLERARSAGIARDNISDFVSDRCGAGSGLFFSNRTWTEENEGNVMNN